MGENPKKMDLELKWCENRWKGLEFMKIELKIGFGGYIYPTMATRA